MTIAARIVRVEPVTAADGRSCYTVEVLCQADGRTITIRDVSVSLAPAVGDDVEVGEDATRAWTWIAQHWSGRKPRPQDDVLRRG